jgi:hypothetical protein
MLRILIVTVALAVFGVLMFGALMSDSKWGGITEDNIDVPTDNTFWNVFGTASASNRSPTPVTVAVPPYIKVDAFPNLVELETGQTQIRIFIETMAGSYSEYVASRTAAPVAMPVLFVGSGDPGAVGQTRSDLAFWD